MTRRNACLLLFSLVLAARISHSGILWVEEAYPGAAAIQILHGKVPYRDFVFDKPPLSAMVYLMWGSMTGWMQRAAGALYVMACCWMAHRLARKLWGEQEGWYAALLMGFFLTFDTPSAVMALAPDLLLVAPHLAALLFAARRQAFLAGLLAGIGFLIHVKALIVLAVCLLWLPSIGVALGFVTVIGAGTVVLAAIGALPGFWEQVWIWGAEYSRDSFLNQPLKEAAARTAAWLGFHATAVGGAIVYFWKERNRQSQKILLWTALSLASVFVGWRFFPRYYFQVLPPVVLAASRGFSLLSSRRALALASLLLVPVMRFGPRYVQLASDLLRAQNHDWADVAMNRDSIAGTTHMRQHIREGDTILVWGYRPDILVYTRLPLGAPFLDSQPLTGVLADRHLMRSSPTFPDLARENRAKLTAMSPTWVIDGLGPYNRELALDGYQDLREWLGRYEVLARTNGSVIYRLR